jgi:hypothetical protein
MHQVLDEYELDVMHTIQTSKALAEYLKITEELSKEISSQMV